MKRYTVRIDKPVMEHINRERRKYYRATGRKGISKADYVRKMVERDLKYMAMEKQSAERDAANPL